MKVVRRPYMFVYRTEKDHQELDVINVASALIEFSEETTSMIRVRPPVSFCTGFASRLIDISLRKRAHFLADHGDGLACPTS